MNNKWSEVNHYAELLVNAQFIIIEKSPPSETSFGNSYITLQRDRLLVQVICDRDCLSIEFPLEKTARSISNLCKQYYDLNIQEQIQFLVHNINALTIPW